MDRLEALYLQGKYTPFPCDDVPEAADSGLPGKSPYPEERGKYRNVQRLLNFFITPLVQKLADEMS